jgi:hypothetical protein
MQEHPRFDELRIAEPEPLAVDARLSWTATE